MIIWTKVPKLLEWKPQPNDYKKSPTRNIRKNTTRLLICDKFKTIQWIINRYEQFSYKHIKYYYEIKVYIKKKPKYKLNNPIYNR